MQNEQAPIENMGVWGWKSMGKVCFSNKKCVLCGILSLALYCYLFSFSYNSIYLVMNSFFFPETFTTSAIVFSRDLMTVFCCCLNHFHYRKQPHTILTPVQHKEERNFFCLFKQVTSHTNSWRSTVCWVGWADAALGYHKGDLQQKRYTTLCEVLRLLCFTMTVYSIDLQNNTLVHLLLKS